MALLLLESKRDDLLIPYFELVKSKNPEITFGQFKSNLLEHLTQNGGLRNLSLASNYYLAGAARYYFNGDLTNNKNLALFYPYTPNSQLEVAVNNGEQVVQNHKDVWKKDICQVLNKIILFLRNAYIDSIGEKWEQPEDFGQLPLPKLIKKYTSKITKIKSDDEEDNQMNVSDRASANYTFEIMYSHEDCKKYYEATTPGAWCITYGQGHYDGYIRNLNIHYVIFKRDGWENVPRVPEKDKWVEWNGRFKPQDDYGNSLIALLQSNRNYEPIYITSRWNHGSSDCGSVEADHAYTKEEFQQITGVSDDELKRIFDIWAKNNKNRQKTASEISENVKSVTRKLKEFQMRINGGADIVDYMEKFGIGIQRTLFEKEANDSFSPQMFKKAPFILKIADNDGTNFFFIMDKGKVIFESLCDSTKLYSDCDGFIIPNDFDNENARLDNCIIVPTEKYFMIYNYRYHCFLDVRGEKKFKRVPIPLYSNFNYYSRTNKNMFFEVKKGKYDIALINIQTFKPLTLPNGEVWFNDIDCGRTSYYYEPQNKIFAHFCGGYLNPVLEIIYDMSSREKYFYNCFQKRFFDVKQDNEFTPENALPSSNIEQTITADSFSSHGHKGVYGIHDIIADSWGGYQNTTPSIFYDALTDNPIVINGLRHFDSKSSLETECPIFRLSFDKTFTEYNPNELMKRKIEFFKHVFPKDSTEIVYDKKIEKPIAINGNIIKFYELKTNNDFVFFFLTTDNELVPEEVKYSKCVIVYDSNKHAFVKNESGFPNEKVFVFDELETWGKFENGVIGWYFPSIEVKESSEEKKVGPYTTVKKGCLELNINDLTYYPIEFNDRTDEYLRLFGNENEMADNQEIIQEDIKWMVERIVKNILNEKRMAN